MKIVALICARGNSRGIKNKNLLKFKNTTLLGNAIKQAFRSKYINRVIVSTDSNKIAREALKNKAEVPFVRPSKLSKDNSPEIQTWIHAIKFLNKDKSIDFIVSVPTTSPLRTISDIDNCIERATKKNLDMVFSVTKASKNPYFNIVQLKNKKLSLVCSSKKSISRRQDAPKTFDMSASIYMWTRKALLNSRSLYVKKTVLYEMPAARSIDIDSKLDLKIVEFLLKSKHKKSTKN